MLQSTTRTQLDQLKVPYQDLKRFRKKRFGFRNEVVEGGTELQKENRVGVGRNRTPTTDYIKVNFEDLEKRKPALTLTEKKPKWKCYRQKLMRLKVRKRSLKSF
jgi:hypothetical protein